jgi:hypothetical protein
VHTRCTSATCSATATATGSGAGKSKGTCLCAAERIRDPYALASDALHKVSGSARRYTRNDNSSDLAIKVSNFRADPLTGASELSRALRAMAAAGTGTGSGGKGGARDASSMWTQGLTYTLPAVLTFIAHITDTFPVPSNAATGAALTHTSSKCNADASAWTRLSTARPPAPSLASPRPSISSGKLGSSLIASREPTLRLTSCCTRD